MTIDTFDKLVNALGNAAQPFPISKASATCSTGVPTSLWRNAGLPSQGAIPAAAAVCDNTTLGGLPMNNPTGSDRTYSGWATLVCSNSAFDVYFADRLMHMGGLSGTVTTAQTVNLDASVTTNNMADRVGQSDFTEVQWWLEWYTNTGTTAATATITYTNNAGVTGRTTTVSLAASCIVGNMLQITPNASDSGIKSIQSVQLSVSTGTAGNFGVTATRAITGVSLGLANSSTVADWAMLGFARVRDSACVVLRAMPSTTSTGTLNGTLRLVQG